MHFRTHFACILLGTIALFLISTIGPAAAAPVLPNGGVVLGSLPVIDDEDDYEFTAELGDQIELRMASSDPLYPEIELRDPNGTIVDTGTDCCVSGVEHTVINPGTFEVTVRDGLGNRVGDYQLYFTRIPGANELGTLLNGPIKQETIDPGDLDTYTFVANLGDHITIRSGRASGDLYPELKLYDPLGVLVDLGADALDASVESTVALAGNYTLQVSSNLLRNSGDYDLHLARIPGAAENGFLTDGLVYPGELTLGDLDTFRFPADPGDNITLDLTRLTGDFDSRIELYTPAGVLADSAQGVGAASIAHQTTESGLYTVLVQDGLGRRTGTYSLTFTSDGNLTFPVPTMTKPLLILLAVVLVASVPASNWMRRRRPA
jgi:hypothetical protein